MTTQEHEEVKEKMIEVSMQIIMHAGDARNYIQNSIEFAKNNKIEEANKNVEIAKKELTAAHLAQTQVIQNSFNEEQDEVVNLLLIHAQDTYMTIHSELRMVEYLIDIYKEINRKNEKN